MENLEYKMMGMIRMRVSLNESVCRKDDKSVNDEVPETCNLKGTDLTSRKSICRLNVGMEEIEVHRKRVTPRGTRGSIIILNLV